MSDIVKPYYYAFLSVITIKSFIMAIRKMYEFICSLMKRVIAFKHPVNIIKAYLSAVVCLGIATIVGLGIVPIINDLISTF